jgi:hypothetical protein
MFLKQVTRQNMKSSPKMSGIGMLEVLIALAVLSIGLVGLAVMHLNSLKYAHSSYERSIVSSMALDLEERLWLRVAHTGEKIGCPDLPDVSTVNPILTSDSTLAGEWVTNWSQSTTTSGDTKIFPAKVPNLEVFLVGKNVVGDEGVGPTYAELDLEFTWGEDIDRFDDNEEQGQTFAYTARIFCSFVPPTT